MKTGSYLRNAAIIHSAQWCGVFMAVLATHLLPAQQPTVIHVTATPLQQQVKRLGMNLGGETFYGSTQIARNLVSRNPGFEGEEWQSIVQCSQVTATSCTDKYPGTVWPDGFLDGGTYEFILGSAKGKAGNIVHSTAADKAAHTGITVQFASGGKAPAVNDYLVVRKQTAAKVPGGWQTNQSAGGNVSTETTDISPSSPGVQAVRLSAPGSGSAGISQFFDTTPGHSYVQLRGPYTLRFRAKAVSGNRQLFVRLMRLSTGAHTPFFSKTVSVEGAWKDYSFPFEANETNVYGPVALTFSATGSELLLDDVSVAATTPNGTAFRNEVVDALQRLRPGVLRYMDSGQNFGSSLDNMLAPEGGRRRTSFHKGSHEESDIPLGLHDFLVLCEKIGAEPWYTMQMGMSEREVKDLMEYLGGPATSKYGGKRAAAGHPVPWTQVFPTIHLEYGNEAWNQGAQGASIVEPGPYGIRATDIFRAARSSPWYSAKQYDLIIDGQAVNVWRSTRLVDAAEGYDALDIAPYLFSSFVDDGSIEAVFGPMFAEPEMMDSVSKGIVHQQAEIVAHAKHPARLAVYETNISTESGMVGQASIDAAVPSVGAGIAAIDHMLLMLRDDGIRVQNTFQLGGDHAFFHNTRTHELGEKSPIWGVIIDLGGPTNRVRPSFLAQQLANEAILPTMLATNITGNDPTWNQSLSPNSNVELQGAHELQCFAFTDGHRNTLIVLNLSRATSRSVSIAGENSPAGDVVVKTLTSGRITDNNELSENVRIQTREEKAVKAGSTQFSLPPFSMTVFSATR